VVVLRYIRGKRRTIPWEDPGYLGGDEEPRDLMEGKETIIWKHKGSRRGEAYVEGNAKSYAGSQNCERGEDKERIERTIQGIKKTRGRIKG